MEPEDNPTTVSTNISFLSYNSTGWSKFKAQFVADTAASNDALIVAVQEHFQLNENVVKLEIGLENFDVFALPAFKSDLCISTGRPSGGLALFYPKSMGHCVNRLLVPNSKRVQGITLMDQGEKMLIINVYFPTDKRQNVNDELVCTLQDVNYLLDEHGNGSKVIIMGDLNCDFSRDTHFVSTVKDFMIRNSFSTAWSRFPCDFTYSQSRVTNNVLSTCSSVIDHFLIPSDQLDNCMEATPLHFSTSLSNHDPIFLKLKNEISLNHIEDQHASKRRLPIWKSAKPEHIYSFQRDLEQGINHINVPDAAVYCRNVNCTDDQHISSLDDTAATLMELLETSTINNIPMSSSSSASGKTNIPGWRTFIKPLKDDADFWNAVWLSAGRQENTELHRVMKWTRNKYHRGIKKVKKAEDQLRQSSFIADCLDGKVQNILSEVKRLKGGVSNSASIIDGISNPQNIAEHFKTLYQEIFNVHNDQAEVNIILDEINANLDHSSLEVVDNITPELVEKVIKKLSNEKNDPVFNFKSNAFKVGKDSLCQPFCDLIKSSIIHGHIPDIFLVCSLIPIIKNKRASSMSSKNYRLIASTSLILKVFDGILLELVGQNVKPSPMQFGFQQGQSTTMATWTLTETISYFRSRGGPVYLCLLDLTKAFDRVKLSTLFRLLSERVPQILIRFIIFSYCHQQCSILWGNRRSDDFEIQNGVRQGSVASPSYFNLYIDEIFQLMKDSGLGCRIHNQYYGLIGYADDLALLAPSREALQRMVCICEQFFSSRGINISTDPNPQKSKTVCLSFGLNFTPVPLVLYGRNIPFVHQHEHLGHLISDDELFVQDQTNKINSFTGKYHNLQQRVGFQDPVVMMTLVNTYLLSFYGSNLWDLSSEDSERINTSFNKLVRQLFLVPLNTHNYIVEHLCGGTHIRTKLITRFKNFYRQLQNSGKEEVLHLVKIQERDQRSIFGRNVAYTKRLCHSSSMDNADTRSHVVYEVPHNCAWKLSVLTELIQFQRGTVDLPNLSHDEATELINILCSD